MTVLELALLLGALYVVGVIWDIIDPDAVNIEFNSPGRALLTLSSIGVFLALVLTAISASAAVAVAVVLGYLLAAVLTYTAKR